MDMTLAPGITKAREGLDMGDDGAHGEVLLSAVTFSPRGRSGAQSGRGSASKTAITASASIAGIVTVGDRFGSCSLMGQGRKLFGCRRFRVPVFSARSF